MPKRQRTGRERLTVAVSHIERSITEINNAAQGRVPVTWRASRADLEELRLLVRALADIRDRVLELELHRRSQAAPNTTAGQAVDGRAPLLRVVRARRNK